VLGTSQSTCRKSVAVVQLKRIGGNRKTQIPKKKEGNNGKKKERGGGKDACETPSAD